MGKKTKFQKKENGDDKGSIWTSYSDLFTAVAIIFLVMFVFALLRTSVMSIKTVQNQKKQKEYYEGQIPKEKKLENKKRKENLKMAISEMKTFDNIISKKLNEINNFSNKMGNHRQNIENLLKDQNIKEMSVKRMNIKVNKKNKEIKKLALNIKGLDKNLKLKTDQLQKELKNITQLSKDNKTLTKDLTQKNKIMTEFKIKMEKLQSQHKVEVSKMEKSIKNEKNGLIGMKKSIKYLKIQNQQKSSKVIDLKKAITLFEEEVNKKKTEIETIKVNMEEAKTLSKNSIQKMEMTKDNLVESQKRSKDLTRKVKTLTHNFKNVQKNLDSLKSDFQNQKNKLNDSVDQSKNLKQKLSNTKSQAKNLESLMSSQQKSFNNKIISKNKQLEKSQSNNSELNSMINQLKGKVSSSQSAQSDLQSSLASAVGQLSKSKGETGRLKTVVSEMRGTIENFKNKLSGMHKSDRLQKENISKLNGTLKGQQEKNNFLSGQMKNLNKKVQGLSANVKKCQTNNKELDKVIAEKEGLIKVQKDHNESVMASNQKVIDKVKTIEKLNKKLKNDNIHLHKKILALQDNGDNFQREISTLKTEATNKENDRQKKARDLEIMKDFNNNNEKKVANLTMKNNDLIEKVDDLRKSFEKIKDKTFNAKDDFIKNLGNNIAKKMAKYNVQTEMDDKTGNITLKLDGTFLFKRNDSKLTDKAKKTLKKIIPIYTSEIFKAKKMRDNIDHVNVIGHASPRYKRKFINPADQNTKAYNYNLDLSTNRAKEIVKFILGQKFGEFPYKSNLRDKISVIGKSYSQPIKMSPNSKSDPSCGIYNCSLSRRVEIKFTLKDDPRFYKKFDFLQKE